MNITTKTHNITNFVILSLPKFLLASALLLVSTTSGAQKIDYHKNYYPLVHQAEMHIVENRHSLALGAYSRAFSLVPSPFARDMYNAAVCATLCNEQQQALRLLEGLLLKGASFSFLKGQQIFAAVVQLPEWEMLEQKNTLVHEQYLKQILLPVRKELEWMNAREQYFLLKAGYETYRDTLRSIHGQNVARFRQIWKEYGFPSERLVGIEEPDRFPVYHFLLSQHCQRASVGETDGIADFPGLKEEVKYGNLPPHLFASYVDLQGRNRYGTRTLFRLDGEKALRTFVLPADAARKTDRRRQQTGLETLADYHKKVLFALQDHRFLFPYSGSIMVLRGLDGTELQKILKESRPLTGQ